LRTACRVTTTGPATRPAAEHIALLRQLLADPDPERHEDAVTIVTEWAEAVATDAWGQAEGRSPRERLLAVLQAVAEAMEQIRVELGASDVTEGG
jgi:hypothetical protein